MISLGTAIASLFATAWLQALVLGAVATAASALRVPPRYQQLFWRSALVLPPMATSVAALLRWAVPMRTDIVAAAGPLAGKAEVMPLADRGIDLSAAILPIAVAGWAWLALVLFYTARTILAHLRVSAYLRAIPECTHARTIADVSGLAGFAGVPGLVVRADEEAGPFAAGRATIVLPRWAIDLPDGQRQAVIAHELRHLQRHDPLWGALLAWAAVVSLSPFGPSAIRRLDALAEDDCDGWAAEQRGGGQELAEAILVCAGSRAYRPRFVATMAGPVSSLRRVRRLVQGEAVAMPTGRAGATAAACAALALSCFSVPAFTFPQAVGAAVPLEGPVASDVAWESARKPGPAARPVRSVAKVAPRASRVLAPAAPPARHRRQAGEKVFPPLDPLAPLAPLMAPADASPLGGLNSLKTPTT